MINKIKDKLFDIKCFIQRGREGYSDKDLWDFDCYLAKVISNGLQRLKEKGLTSYPPELVSVKEWENVLNIIIEGFREKLKACNYDTYDFKKVNKALELLSKYFNHFWD